MRFFRDMYALHFPICPPNACFVANRSPFLEDVAPQPGHVKEVGTSPSSTVVSVMDDAVSRSMFFLLATVDVVLALLLAGEGFSAFPSVPRLLAVRTGG